MRRTLPIISLLAAYCVLLLATDLVLPLRIPEILHVLAAWHFSLTRMIGWIAQTPGSAPLSYFTQLPFLLIWPHGRLAARAPSLIFAIAVCMLLLKLFKEIPLRRPALALGVFMLLPISYRSAVEARGFECALFLTVLQILTFSRLIREPTVRHSVLYGAVLTLCLYTEPHSFLPAIGSLLFLLRFVARAHERRAVWFTLPASIAPVLAFLPYYLWAVPQVSPNWIFGPVAPPREWNAFVVAALLAAGFCLGTWASVRVTSRNPLKQILLFCVAGGVVSTIIGGQILWAVPGLILLFFAGLEWLSTNRMKRIAAACLVALLILCCIPSDARYLTSQTENVQAEAAAVLRESAGNSCIVFLTQGFSRDLFVLFEPQLESRECLNFFHRRIIVAVHPYIDADKEQMAYSYFRGLGFRESKTLEVGGGKIIMFDTVPRP